MPLGTSHGGTDTVPPDVAREHCRRLVAAGMTLHEIADAAGVSRWLVQRLLQPNIARDSERRLLRVPVPGYAHVDDAGRGGYRWAS